MAIRASTAGDLGKVRDVILAAFDESERDVVYELVTRLLQDPTARPLTSLVAESDEGRIVGHVLFSAVKLVGSGRGVSASILAPLAVHPDFQSQGIGGQLINEGLRRLGESGVQLVFVLGYPAYYQRFAFQPAASLGLEAPYPIAEENADAWMVLALQNGILGSVRGRVECADSLNRPELWRE